MAVDLVKEKYASPINEVEIGGQAGIKIGGESTLPFLFEEGAMPNPPVTSLEVFDCVPEDWPAHLKEPFGDALKDPVKWAKMCARDFGSKMLTVRMLSAHQDWGARPVDKVVDTLKRIAQTVEVPLVVVGCGDDEKDNDLLPKASQAMKGRNCLFGIAVQNNYKTLAATCLADGHSIIAESPIDVNIAKQLNILITDMGLDAKRIVMHPTTASLGYGMEYAYSIMERARLAAYMGDKMLSMPFILFVGQEVWKAKEAKEFGRDQGINWEAGTAVSMLQAGADILVMRHPESARLVNGYINSIMKG